jgi:hypothetical protein
MVKWNGDDSIQTLTDSFTSMIESVNAIDGAANNIDININEGHKNIVNKICGENKKISAKMQESIVAFQFYDKLSQRLSHVSHALDALAELVGDQTKLYNPNEWIELQGKIRSRYSMREEQQMFDLLLSGASFEEALSIGQAVIHKLDDGDIELF